ncbi:MAG: hypothetical protein IJ170_11745 [Ruminococcus sp.]|nr:hypothetical protein [Ruminococcus sp.]
MKMRRTPDPRMSLPAALVGGVLALAYVWFVYRDFVHTAIAAVIVAVAVVFIIYSQSREQKADRKAAKERPELEDGSRFSSVEWRKGYLDFAQEKGWESPERTSMKADMCRHYNNGADRAMILMGAFFTACGAALLFSPQSPLVAVGGIALGAFCLYFGIKDICGYTVRKWMRSTKLPHEELEKSYMSGRLLTFRKNGVNIGSELIIFFNKETAGAIKLSELSGARRHIVRLKKYQDGTYAGEEYQHFLELSSLGKTVQVRLTEHQVEMALEELERRSGYISGNSPISQDRDDETIV